MVVISALPVIAARQVLFSAFLFFAIVPSAFQLYQTGFDSLTAPAFICIDVSAFWSHGGIHAVMRYANACVAIVSAKKVATAGRKIRLTFGSPAVCVQTRWLCALPSPGVCLCRVTGLKITVQGIEFHGGGR